MSQKTCAWRSARLIFKSVEAEDDDFLFEMRSDSEAFLNTAPMLPAPPRRQDASKYREFMGKCPLGVIICISKADSPSTDSDSSSALEAGAEAVAGADSSPTKTDSTSPSNPKPNIAPFHPPSSSPKETLIPIGDMHLRSEENPLFAHHRSTEIGISIHRNFQGKGYGSEAIEWVLEWAFRRANFHRVGIGYLGWNERAGRLYGKVSFSFLFLFFGEG
jgi:hypothetical protein